MKAHLLLFGLAAIALTVQARTLTPDQALARALENAPAQAPAYGEQAQPSLQYTAKSANGQPGCYLFSSNSGFMIVSADDVAPALLGYGSDVDAANMPPAMKYWLDLYSQQIAYANSLGLPAYAPAQASEDDYTPIEPLTTTRWNQATPYNDLCPMDDGSRSVTGCVATALSQVMKYHNYPAKGKSQHSYQCLGQTLTVDFANTEYKWDDMLDIYYSSSTEAQRQAVATLCYSCGVAVNMEYTSSESSASSISVPSAMVKYFDYDKGVRYLARDYYGLKDWQKIVYEQLRDYGPVQYSGQSSEGGHSFVCDGYSSDGYFHINWGWGGVSDGYFLLTALDPTTQGIGGSTSGFNYDQDIIACVSKPREGSRVYEQWAFEENFSIAASASQVGASVVVDGPVFNLSIEAISGMLGLKFVDTNGNTFYAEGTEYSAMPQLSGYNSYNATIPASLPDGIYTVTPAFKTSYGEWQDIQVPLSGTRAALAAVSEGDVQFTTESAPTLDFTQMHTNLTPYYIGCNFEITAKINNPSEIEYYGSIVAAILNSSETVVAYGDNYAVDLMPGETVDMDYISEFSHQPSSSESYYGEETTLEPGQYTLCFMSADLSTTLSNSVTITLQAQPSDTQLAVNSLQLADGGSVVTDQAHMQVVATIACESGYFADDLTLAIFSADSEESIAAFTSEVLFINANEQKTVTFSGDFSEGQAGVQYYAMVFDGQDQLGDSPLEFTIQTSSLQGVQTAPVAVEFYTLDGRKVAGSAPAPGLYIKRSVGADGSVQVSKVMQR